MLPKFFDLSKVNEQGHDDHSRVKIILSLIITTNANLNDLPAWLFNINPEIVHEPPPGGVEEIAELLENDPSLSEVVRKMGQNEKLTPTEKVALLIMIAGRSDKDHKQICMDALPMFVSAFMNKTPEQAVKLVYEVLAEFSDQLDNATDGVMAQLN